MTKFTDSIPHLNIEVLESGCIRLENESMGDSYVVDLHPVHLRHIVEKTGLVRKLSASESDAVRTAATLQRRMLALRDRIDSLADWMEKFSDHKHADLTCEMTQLHALQDLACEWCFEFDDNTTAMPNAELTTVDSESKIDSRPAQTAQTALL